MDQGEGLPLVNLLKETVEIETRMAEKSSWDQANRRQHMVWFGEIERKLAKKKYQRLLLLAVLPLNYFMDIANHIYD